MTAAQQRRRPTQRRQRVFRHLPAPRAASAHSWCGVHTGGFGSPPHPPTRGIFSAFPPLISSRGGVFRFLNQQHGFHPITPGSARTRWVDAIAKRERKYIHAWISDASRTAERASQVAVERAGGLVRERYSRTHETTAPVGTRARLSYARDYRSRAYESDRLFWWREAVGQVQGEKTNVWLDLGIWSCQEVLRTGVSAARSRLGTNQAGSDSYVFSAAVNRGQRGVSFVDYFVTVVRFFEARHPLATPTSQ